jgi:hypothetical protein
VLKAVLIASLAVPLADGLAQDSVRDAARQARATAAAYERAVVRSAPQHFGSRYTDRCDERIGRYCFWFSAPDRPRRPVDPETPEVASARATAIHAFRRWFALAPDHRAAAGPLIRYLIEGDRTREAVAAARAHVWAADRSAESFLFLGLALHNDQDITAAEAMFDSARARAAPDERRRLDDLTLLLERRERTHYRSLDNGGRAEYEARFWALSDPWMMRPGNERRSGHYARHALSRIQAMAPRVEGRLRWGRDDHEILLRYGPATGRQRLLDLSPGSGGYMTLVEWFDPRRVALTPERLVTSGLPSTPQPGERPWIEQDTVRSDYAPLGMRRARGLIVTATLFPGAGGSGLRVDALLPPDSVEPRVPVDPRGILVVLDTMGAEVGRVHAEVRVAYDTLTLVSVGHPLEPGAWVYRVEVRDDSTGLGGLAQYRIDVPAVEGLAVSDLLVAMPGSAERGPGVAGDALEGIPRLVFRGGEEIAVFAEVTGLAVADGGASLDVQWWVEPAGPGGILRRAARWVGERVGLVDPSPPLRVVWREGGTEGTHGVLLDLRLPDLDRGLHHLGLRVVDRVSGDQREAMRLIRVDPEAPPLPRPAGR